MTSPSTTEIKILNFITPHLFYITTDVDEDNRTNFLNNLSSRIKKCQLGPIQPVENEIVAVHHETNLVRASILAQECNEGTLAKSYHCWLIDYGLLIKTDKLFQLPKDIQKMTPRCKQASLSNFCYLTEMLQLGITGTIKTIPTQVPSQNVVQYSLDLLANHDKIVFEESDRHEGIIIGEVIIHKNGKVIYMTQELLKAKLIFINELLFQNLLHSTKEYMKTHLKSIYVCGSSHKIAAKISKSDKSIQRDTSPEKNDILQPLIENGRRRRLLNQKTSEVTFDSDLNTSDSKPDSLQPSFKADKTNKELQAKSEKPLTRNELLLKKIKSQNEAKPKKVEDTWNKIVQYKKKCDEDGNTSSCDSNSVSSSISDKNKSTEGKSFNTSGSGNECNQEKFTNVVNIIAKSGNEGSREKSSSPLNNTTDSNVSLFAAITSQKSNKPRPVVFPAEFTFKNNVTKRSSKKSIKKDRMATAMPDNFSSTDEGTPKTSQAPIVKANEEEDCPTIKVPNDSDNLTDVETENKTEKIAYESSSSESLKPEIFTKQDFCRLVAGCTCIKCRITLDDDDWDAPLHFSSQENEVKKPSASKKLIIRPPKLLKTQSEIDSQDVPQTKILFIDYAEMTSMEKRLSCKVLVHGESIPMPIRQVCHVNIQKDIYNNISRINYKQSKRIQHYAFPAITRNQHVFMINDAKSGKTMAYLPILISFIMEKDERYRQLFKMGGGPFVVILCSDSKKCEEIHDLIKLILNKQNRKCSLVTYPGYGNISNVDILITMPTVMSHLISTRATNFKRLCHLVLEDADIILKSHNDLIIKYINYADQVLVHRNCPKSIQLIMCAQHWTVQLENILLKLNKVPLVCIGNYLEAALYGKMKLSIKFLDTGCKEQSLQRVLYDKYKYTKSVVICNADEVEDIQTFLTLKGIEYISFHGVDKEEDILYLESVWNNALGGRYSVLVCTDDIYNTMNITSAQLLVHFSLPYSWTQFIKRFRCLLESIQSPLDNSLNKFELSSYVFIDENCEPRMSKFSNFIKIAGIEKDLPDKIKTFFMGISAQEEQTRLSRKIELCNTVKIFGKCDSLLCKKRHILEKDLDDNSGILPKNGTIRFKILKMTSAGSCTIKLLEHFDLNGTSVLQYEDRTQEISDILSKKSNYRLVSKGHISHLYLHKDNDQYFRCKLIEVDDFALVYLIDKGIYCKSNSDRLYKMPDVLKKIPAQAYEVYFANLIPPYDDSKFSRLASRKAQFFIDSNCPDSIMTGTILLRLGHNLWLDDVYEYREMYDKSFPCIGYQLTRDLVKQGLAVKDKNPLEKLYSLCKMAKIELPEYQVVKPTVEKVVNQVQPNWAFLDLDDVQGVIFTSGATPYEFYVRQSKFTQQLQQLEETIQKEIRKPFYPKPEKIEIGKCYLAKDEVTGDYSRGLILSLNGEEAEVLCVDYGDIVYADVSTLKHISSELILKLPFQSIQCSLWGIKPIYEEWSTEATDSLYTVAYEEDQSTLRKLLIKVNAKQENPVVQKQKSYKVTLASIKDGLPRYVNDLLINCGFAMPNNKEEMLEFELPKMHYDEDVDDDDDDDSIEEIIRFDDGTKEQMTEQCEKIDYDAFDFEIINFDGFLDTIDLPITRPNKNNTKAIEDKKSSNNHLPPMKTAPVVDFFTPEVVWSETGTHIRLSIKISDIVDAKIVVKHNRKFQFSADKNGKKYSLNLILFAKVESTIQHTILGSQIRVVLKKCKAASWPRLLHTKEKVRKIYYDISAMNLNDEDEKKRRPLQLDISDSNSEEDEKDINTPYYVCSDIDSDYDFDIPNDEY